MYSCTWLTCTACMCLRAWSTAGGRCVRSSVSVGCKRVDGRAANDVLECCRLSECFSQRIGDWGDRKGLGDTLLYFPRAASCLDIIRTELHVGLRSALSAYGAYLVYVSMYLDTYASIAASRLNERTAIGDIWRAPAAICPPHRGRDLANGAALFGRANGHSKPVGLGPGLERGPRRVRGGWDGGDEE